MSTGSPSTSTIDTSSRTDEEEAISCQAAWGGCPTRKRRLIDEFDEYDKIESTECIDVDDHFRTVDGKLPDQSVATSRMYHLDWMRIAAIYFAILFHVVQVLDWVGFWCGHQREQSIAFRRTELQLGMPLFFHIAGRSQSMGTVRSLCDILVRRGKRLVIPFLVCYVLLIPPWLWIHQRDQMTRCVGAGEEDPYRTTVRSVPDIPQNLLIYLLRYWTLDKDVFWFDPAWLWFLPALYLVTVACTPVILFGEDRKPQHFVLAVASWIAQGVYATFVLGLPVTFSLLLGLGPVGSMVLVMLVPFPPTQHQSDPANWWRRWVAIPVTGVLHIVATVGAVRAFQYEELGSGAAKGITTLLLYPPFYMQGYFAERYWPAHYPQKRSPGGKLCHFAAVAILFLFAFFGASAGGKWEYNSWPVYSASFHDGKDSYAEGFVLGTWAWICFSDAVFRTYLDDQIDPTFHQHASNSTFVVYIFHWVFLKPFAFFVIRDLGLMHGVWKYVVPAVTFIVGVGGSLLVYTLLLRWPSAGRLLGVGA